MKPKFVAGLLLWGGAFLLANTISVALGEELRTSSTITSVTVYPRSALITRRAKLVLQPGVYTVMFENIVPSFDSNSLSVKGEGSAVVKLFGARQKTEYLKEAADKRIKELEKKIEEIQNEIDHKNNIIGVLAEEKTFLKSIKLFSGEQLPKDLVTKVPSIEELNNLRQFLTNSFKEIENGKEKLMNEIRELNKEKKALKKQLNELRRSNTKKERLVAVDLECIKAGKLNLDISYVVRGVFWRPIYDARVFFAKQKLHLAAYAFVKQTTGEDWSNVTIKISTAKPSIGGKMPDLFPWYLRIYHPRPLRRKAFISNGLQVQKGWGGMQPRNAAIMNKEEDLAGKAVLNKATEVYAQLQMKGTALTYKITKPVTIKADGEEYRVPITVQRMPVLLEYAATPKLSPYAYLWAKVTNGKDNQILPGQVNVFLDENFVGTSQIAKAIGSKETFDLYLGIDEGIKVERRMLEKKSDDTIIGNIPSPTKTISYKYKLIAENHKSKEITLNFFDNIPVPKDDKIRVKNLRFSLKPTQQNYEDRQGVMKWVITLKPGEKKEIVVSFIVEHPRNIRIEGL